MMRMSRHRGCPRRSATAHRKALSASCAGGRSERDAIIVVCNFRPVPRPNCRVNAPQEDFWREILTVTLRNMG